MPDESASRVLIGVDVFETDACAGNESDFLEGYLNRHVADIKKAKMVSSKPNRTWPKLFDEDFRSQSLHRTSTDLFANRGALLEEKKVNIKALVIQTLHLQRSLFKAHAQLV